uniref:plasmid recombination protein n=1 Tax=Staphylococcus saprophyticus TaxID=29385 RepID=UPI0021B16CDF
DNLLYGTVDMEEKRGDMDYGVVGIREDGGLSGKEVLGNKKGVSEFEDRFKEDMNSCGYELSRGIRRGVRGRGDEEISGYKNLRDYEKEEYEDERGKLEGIKEEREEVMEEYENGLDVVKKGINVGYEVESEKVGGVL